MSFTLFGALNDLDESRHRAELYRAWEVGLGAGFTHDFSLEQIGRIRAARTEAIRRYLLVGTRLGRAITPLVHARPMLFDPFEAALLAAGDESGTLANSLRLLSDQFRREYARMLKVRSYMGYPVFLGLLAAFSLTLPFLHRGGARAYLAAIGGAIAALLLIGGVPISILAGVLAARSAYSIPRFARALAVGAEAGLPLGRLVQLSVAISDNADLKRHIANRSERQLSIIPLANLFEGCRAVPAELLGQMKVADATGDYAATLTRYADTLESKA